MPGYEGEDLVSLMKKISQGRMVMLDRWKIDFSETKNSYIRDRDTNKVYPLFPPHTESNSNSHSGSEGPSTPEERAESSEGSEGESAPNEEDLKGDPIPATNMNNYFSIGVDASVAWKFHHEREKYPEKFKSRIRNKMIYVDFAMREMLQASCKNLYQNLHILCDGEPLPLTGPLEGIAILNIPSIYGGVNLWGESPGRPRTKGGSGVSGGGGEARKKQSGSQSAGSANQLSLHTSDIAEAQRQKELRRQRDLVYSQQDIGDGLLEVVGIENTLHIGQVTAGLQKGRRLAQCSSIVIRTRKRLPMQIDGEPWMQPSCTISITHLNTTPVNLGPNAEKKCGIFFGLFSHKS